MRTALLIAFLCGFGFVSSPAAADVVLRRIRRAVHCGLSNGVASLSERLFSDGLFVWAVSCVDWG